MNRLLPFLVVVAAAATARAMPADIGATSNSSSSSAAAVANVTAPMDSGVFGLDVSTAVGASAWQCLYGTGFRYAVVRAVRSNCRIDGNANGNLAAAKSAGFSADAYWFASVRCGSPSALMKKFKDSVSGYGRLWLDVEGPGLGYWGSIDSNVEYVNGLVQAAQSLGISVGIYTSSSQWIQIMGSSNYQYASSVPLWYAHYDGRASYSDFQPFAGWSQPYMKQISDHGDKCGASYDINWRA